MASASTSSVEKSYIYDVFISFRGKDLRTNFVDHLSDAFRKSGIIVFKDDKDIEVGESISDELPKAIKDSKFHIVIFSQRYADSYWCLNELVEILECQNPTFYPIFYHVKPSEVRNQEGPVGEAFSVHLENEAAGICSTLKRFYAMLCKEAFAVHLENEAVGRWRIAMKKAASLEGWELTKTGDGHEVQFIEKIVRTISQKPYFAKFGVDGNLVGVVTPVEELLSTLQVGVDDVRMTGITGLGGVGKTTLASVVFNRIANQFKGKSFVRNVRERSKDPRGLQDMQKQILTSVFGDQSIDVPSDVEGRNMMEKRMPSIKVLVVLDDVNDGKQLEELAEPSWFRPGSRIIITSRERQVLVAHGVQIHNIHDVSTLSKEDAIRLHSRYAFKTESPAQGYEELSEEVLHYAAGLPLTIKTLSSSLCARPTEVWKDAIKRLKTIPWGDTLKILEISYDALEKDQKDIFLHVACLLKGETKKKAIRILTSLGFYAQVGLSVLEQKSLITFRDGRHKELHVVLHDHIEEMGMHIVRSVDPDVPERHKLLWIKDEIENILEKDMGTEAIRGIKLLRMHVHPAKISQSLIKMSKLCFFYVGRGSYVDWESYTPYKFDEAGKYLPNSLQFLHWRRYPYRYLPKTFDADKLVQMEMPFSYIHQLWEGVEKKVLPKLRFLDLRFSKLETFDSAITPNLEELVLKGCQNLVEVNISGKCSHVKKVVLSRSTDLKKLTISNECQNLEELDLDNCTSFRELQMHGECPSRLKSLYLSHTKLRSLNLGLTPNLEVLTLDRCKDLEELVMPVQCQKLTTLYLRGIKLRSLNLGLTPNLELLELIDCEDIDELVMPDQCQKITKLSFCGIKLRSLNLGHTPNLEQLQLEKCIDLEELVMPVQCQKLTELSVSGIKLRSLNLGLTPKLEQLLLRDCEDLEELVMPVECQKITKLSVSGIKLRSLNLGLTPNLEQLLLRDCEDLEELVMPVECQKITKLSVSGIKLRSLNFGLTPNLEPLRLEECMHLEELVMPVQCQKLTEFSLSAPKLRSLNLGLTPNLEELLLEDCEDLEELVMPVECQKLTNLSLISATKLRKLNLGLTPNLEELLLEDCKDFEEIYVPVERPARLRVLSLLRSESNGEPGSLSYLEKLKSLEELSIMSKDMNRLPDSIYMLKHLRVLDLGYCLKLKQLPEDLDRLECLEELNVRSCSLRNIPNCICKMTRLKRLILSYCYQLEKLPDEFRRLQSLQELEVIGIADRLKNLPESIFQLKNLLVFTK